MAAAFRALERRKMGQGRAEKGVLGGEDVQSDHTHLIVCREEGKGHPGLGGGGRVWTPVAPPVLILTFLPQVPGSPSLLQGFTIPEPGKVRH